MGKIIDISSKITTEPIFLHIAEGKNYKINDSKNTVLKIMALWNTDDGDEIKKIEEMIKLSLGTKAYKEIEEMELPFSSYRTLATAIMASISGQTVEEFEERFQNAATE